MSFSANIIVTLSNNGFTDYKALILVKYPLTIYIALSILEIKKGTEKRKEPLGHSVKDSEKYESRYQ